MPEKWDQERIERDYINAQTEESLNLDYKAAGALAMSDGKKKEITKDVSAMANSDGGIIIYGIMEYQEEDKKHLPEKLDPIDRTEFPKEWLEQVINNIRPRLDGVLIHPVDADTGSNDVVYVVEIPQSKTAHQAKDYRYYKRFNFESVPMEDYEIRDVMNRTMSPDIHVEFGSIDLGNNHYRVLATVRNEGAQVVNRFKLEFLLPHLDSISLSTEMPSHDPSDPIGRVEVKRFSDSGKASIEKKKGVRDCRIIFRSIDVLFPQDKETLDTDMDLRCTVYSYALRKLPKLTMSWTLYADNMQPKQGQMSLYDLCRTHSRIE